MDVVGAVMRELHLSAAGYRRLELGAPWAVSFSQAGLRGIHIVLKGRCEVAFDHGPAQQLEQGDLIIAPRADAHVLRSRGATRTPVVPAAALADATVRGRIRAGGDGERTVIVCGAFAFEEADHPALAGLPRIVRVPGARGRLPRWLRGYVDALMAEALDEGPGSAVVMARLSAAIVTRALRHDIASASEPGWVRGLSDPFIAKALGVMHDDCAHPWTVQTVARNVGLSRAVFAAHSANSWASRPCVICSCCACGRPARCCAWDGRTRASRRCRRLSIRSGVLRGVQAPCRRASWSVQKGILAATVAGVGANRFYGSWMTPPVFVDATQRCSPRKAKQPRAHSVRLESAGRNAPFETTISWALSLPTPQSRRRSSAAIR